jgi:hypothetical protein
MLFQMAASGFSRFVVPAAVMAGLAWLILVTHLGVVGGLRERLRDRRRATGDGRRATGDGGRATGTGDGRTAGQSIGRG